MPVFAFNYTYQVMTVTLACQTMSPQLVK